MARSSSAERPSVAEPTPGRWLVAAGWVLGIGASAWLLLLVYAVWFRDDVQAARWMWLPALVSLGANQLRHTGARLGR